MADINTDGPNKRNNDTDIRIGASLSATLTRPILPASLYLTSWQLDATRADHLVVALDGVNTQVK